MADTSECTKENGDKEKSPFTVYYFPTSYSSQKVLLALYEKGLQFKSRLVSLFHGQHMEPWYMRLNPEGAHVPVLVDGDTVITDPEEIIRYIDHYSCSDPVLIPDPETPLGESVVAVCEQLAAVPMDIITYGVIFHPQLSPSGCHLPFAVQRSMRENFAKRLQQLTQKATRYPDLRDSYLARSQMAAHKYDMITDEDKVRVHLDQLDSIFTSIEHRLSDFQSSSGEGMPGGGWLFGMAFTIADIAFSALLCRLSLLGLDSRFFPPGGCPHIARYYARLQRRPAFLRLQQEIRQLRTTLIWEDIKAASPYILGAAGIGLVAALTFRVLRSMR